jgi:hypothetical protein
MRRATWLLIALVALLAGCQTADQGEMSDTEPLDPAAVPFEQRQTLACLRGTGASVDRLAPSDQELRALRDLAQRKSFRIRASGRRVALAFGRDVAAAQLLEELLAVPRSSYTIVRRGNVVVLYRRGEPPALSSVARCLPE